MCSRSERGVSQRMYLLNADRSIDLNNNFVWNFRVKGSSNSIYDMSIDTTSSIINCGCMDFITRKKVCKHMYFLIGVIAKDLILMNRIETKESLNLNDVKELDKQLIEKLQRRLEKVEPESCCNITNLNTEENCIICFEILGKIDLWQCNKRCNNIIHKSCMHQWLQHNKSCPYCRINWIPNELNNQEGSNPLEALENCNIETLNI